jgi:2-polyprenyl-3-methyl-5-hydroxy-6-metoxy-1,4-benzoquinol methylase
MVMLGDNKLVRTLQRAAYFVQTGYLFTGERVNPDFPNAVFDNHLKVYKFLAQYAAGKAVLDVGCGTGYGTALLAQSAKEIVGIDISKQAIRFAKRRYPEVSFLRMDAHALTFAPNTFDFIVSTENFEHLRDQAGHLRQLTSVLRQDGLCFIATPNPEMFCGQKNSFHTKENSFQELTTLLDSYFDRVTILENQLTPPSTEGRDARAKRFAQGCRGLIADGQVTIMGKRTDTTNLCNSHSFFSFCQLPKTNSSAA